MAQNPSPEHQRLVAGLITALRNNGHTVLSAAHEGFPAPDAHGRHQPDLVTMDQGGVLHLGEAKVGDDLYSQVTQEQLEDFPSRIMSGTSIKVLFHIVVYRQDETILYDVLNRLDLNNRLGTDILVWLL